MNVHLTHTLTVEQAAAAVWHTWGHLGPARLRSEARLPAGRSRTILKQHVIDAATEWLRRNGTSNTTLPFLAEGRDLWDAYDAAAELATSRLWPAEEEH